MIIFFIERDFYLFIFAIVHLLEIQKNYVLGRFFIFYYDLCTLFENIIILYESGHATRN